MAGQGEELMPIIATFDNLCQNVPNSAGEVIMATMNVSLPDGMKAWVEGRALTGRYSNASDYVRDLIRRDQERADKVASMQQLVDEALAGGVTDRTLGDILETARMGAGVERGTHGL